MDYLFALIQEALDKLLEAKGYLMAKQMMGERQKDKAKVQKKKLKSNVIKFSDLIKKD